MADESASPIAVVEQLLEVEAKAADFIANGPDGGLAGHIRDGYRKRCDQLANAAPWAQLLLTSGASPLARICQPWWNKGGFDGPVAKTAFSGGQCDGVTYIFEVRTRNMSTSPPSWRNPVQLFKQGPLQIVKASAVEPSCNDPAAPFQGNAKLVSKDDPSGVTLALGCFDVADGYEVISVTRNDGQPDECGDPSPVLAPGPNPPPDPGPTSGPEPTEDPNNPTGAPLLPIPPYDDPIGGPTPIVGPDPYAPTVGPDDLPGNPDTGPGGGENIGDPIAVDPGPGGGGDDVDFGNPPAGRSWVGCLLQFAFPETAGVIAGSGPANPVSPRIVGNASLVYEGGRGTAERVNCGNFQLFRPSGSLKVTGVYVNVEPGFTYNVRPVSIANCPENECI